MAESGGQKPIRNTLLSGATGANFFEEAAMLIPVPVPVPVPESQEPATAEIDLNSDDSSSNRGSLEKDLPATLNFNDGDGVEAVPDEPAAPISLFSRAATSVDAFSRMLAGAPRPEMITPKQEITPEPAIVQLTATPPQVSSTGPVMPSFGMPSQNPPATSPQLIPVAPVVASSGPLNPVSSTKPPELNNEQYIPSASSIFSSGPSMSSTSLFPSSEQNVNLFTAPSVSASASQPVPYPTPPSAFATVAPTCSRPSAFYSNSSSPSPGPGTMTTASLSKMPFMSPESSPSATMPPPATSATGNAFRLGGQRMKYVACPEMQSSSTTQVQSPTYRPPQQAMSPVISPPAGIQSHFTPIRSALPSTPSVSYQQTPSPVVSSLSAGSDTQSVPTSFTPPRASLPHVNPNSYYHPPGVGTVEAMPYVPQELPALTYHWFYRKDVDGKAIWKPFSIIDSVALEDAFANDKERMVPTDGGRYDVSVKSRLKNPVYWLEAPIEVRRGSWFFKGPMDNRFVPYDEDFALRLEHEYADCMKTGVWQKRLEFPEGESVIMHSAGVVVHFCQAAAPDDWGNLPESQIRPRVVKRGVEEIEIEDGESTQIDHLVFVVHGIGPICDFKLRNIVEAVDDFRGLSIQLLNSHFRESIERNLVGRVEFLPVSWHKALHGDRGIDERLKRITLRSIPKFRDFTNDTLLDILFYTSPVYCQTIIDSVSSELNRMYKLFLSRNPTFRGKVSLTGHSLGSLILFDLLAHQPHPGAGEGSSAMDIGDDNNSNDALEDVTPTAEVSSVMQTAPSSSRTVSYTVGNAGTGQPFITYPKIDFSPTAFFALGSPIAMFVTVRGIEELGNDFRLPTCPTFFNIFHPYDPVAYRIETLIDPNFQSRPVLIPHHKGRKRIHLELKETMARVGADIKHRVIDAVKNTLNTVSYYTGFSKNPETLESEIQSAIAGEMEKKSEADGAEDENAHLRIGSLNGGRRIDHVLQEAPYETFNEYVFAMSTHLGYWESEDTMLLILTEIYGTTMGIQKDRQVGTQQSITSPTYAAPPPVTQAVSSFMNAYPSSVYGQSNNNYSASFQPSAPPAPVVEYQPLGQPATQAFYNNGSPSVSSTAAPSVPMISPTNQAGGALLPPNPAVAGSGGKPTVIGNRPVADPNYYPRGMDPTAPMLSMSQVGPPPKAGFVPKQN